MKTLFTVDSSGLVGGCVNYFNKLASLRNQYYNRSRGDKLYIWNLNYECSSESSMNNLLITKVEVKEETVI